MKSDLVRKMKRGVQGPSVFDPKKMYKEFLE
jgi:hypothetical protein